MNILVTGGAGFIGSNFILYWISQHPEDRIINIDKLTYAGNLENLCSLETNRNYDFVKGDICDMETVAGLVKKVDLIVHFAAESHVDRSIADAARFVSTNVLGTQVLLEAARKAGSVRFHHVSTDEVFGDLDPDSTEKFNELSHYKPSSPYAATKAGSDHMVRAYHRTYGLPVTISNCSNNYGPFQFPEKFIPLAITNILEGKKIPLYGLGNQIRDWLYVEDHCRALDLIISKGRIGETYCIGGTTESISNKEILIKLINIMKADPGLITNVADRPGHDRKYAVDWNKINRELGWAPKDDLDTYLKKTVDWYLSNQKWWQKIKSGEYLKYYMQQYGRKI